MLMLRNPLPRQMKNFLNSRQWQQKMGEKKLFSGFMVDIESFAVVIRCSGIINYDLNDWLMNSERGQELLKWKNLPQHENIFVSLPPFFLCKYRKSQTWCWSLFDWEISVCFLHTAACECVCIRLVSISKPIDLDTRECSIFMAQRSAQAIKISWSMSALDENLISFLVSSMGLWTIDCKPAAVVLNAINNSKSRGHIDLWKSATHLSLLLCPPWQHFPTFAQ